MITRRHIRSIIRSKHANMIKDYDAKHGSLDDVSNSKSKVVEAEFGGIKNGGAGLDVQKDD